MLLIKLFILCLSIVLISCVENNEFDTPSIQIENTLNEFESNRISLNTFASKECTFKINGGITEPQPLFIVPGSTEFYNPDDSGIVHVPFGKEIELNCNRGFDAPFTNLKIIKAKCKGGPNYDVGGKTYDFANFNCTKTNEFIGRRTAKICYNKSIIAEIGFELSDKRFVKTMEVCHNEILGSTYYTQHSLSPFSGKFQRNVERPYFQKGKFFKNRNVDKLYKQNDQMKTVGLILGGNHGKYFDLKKDVYLARGHLAAKADYVYGSQQLSTFLYINVAPQWQTFNAGNWLYVEENLRKYVAKNKLFVDLYTGTYGVMQLKNSKNQLKDIYLYMDPFNSKANQIPVPKLFYKVVIDRKSKKGIVLIGVNNPHLTLDEIKRDYIICNDISDKINWINWVKDDILQGYSYACSVPGFVKVVNHLPKLSVKGILL